MNFWKIENRFSIEMNLDSFLHNKEFCCAINSARSSINIIEKKHLARFSPRALPTRPSSSPLEGSYFNPIERLLNRYEIKYKTSIFPALSSATDRNDIAFLAWLKTISNYKLFLATVKIKKKRIDERTNEWMDGWMEKFVIECLLLSLESVLSACRAVSWLGNQRDRRREIPPGKSRDTIWHSWF